MVFRPKSDPSPPLNPSSRTFHFTSFTERPHLYTQKSWNLKRVCGSHLILCPAGNGAPLQIHQFSKSAELFCFIPSSYVQKPEFQQNFFCDVFLDLRASVGTHLSSPCQRTSCTHKAPHQRDQSQLLPKLFKTKSPTQVLAQRRYSNI